MTWPDTDGFYRITRHSVIQNNKADVEHVNNMTDTV